MKPTIDKEKLEDAFNDKIDYANILHTLFYKYFGTEEEIKEMDNFINEILDEDNKEGDDNNEK